MNLEDIVVSRTGVVLRSLLRGNPLTNQVQQRLLDVGFLDPPVDGDFAPVSQLALKQFADAVGLNVAQTLEPDLAQGLLEGGCGYAARGPPETRVGKPPRGRGN